MGRSSSALRAIAEASPKPVHTGVSAASSLLPRILTVAEAAAVLRVSTPTVYSLIKGGDLPAITFSTRAGRGVVRIYADDVRAFLTKHYKATR